MKVRVLVFFKNLFGVLTDKIVAPKFVLVNSMPMEENQRLVRIEKYNNNATENLLFSNPIVYLKISVLEPSHVLSNNK